MFYFEFMPAHPQYVGLAHIVQHLSSEPTQNKAEVKLSKRWRTCVSEVSSISTMQLSRNQRFSASFQHSVETLVNLIMPHITQKYKDNLDAARNANHSLAVFIKVRTCSCSPFLLTFCFPGCIFKDLFCPLVAMFQPDGQRLRLQTNQQLHELLHAWRPKGRPAVTRKLIRFRTPAALSLSSDLFFFFFF